MVKEVIGLLTALFVAGTSLAYAQDASHQMLSQTDFNILTDARIGIVKAMLQLTPEQAKKWPAVEDAIRARAEARYRRIAALEERLNQERELDSVELWRAHADALSERAANLRTLVDAWQPLYESLSPDQKTRMRILAVHVLHQLRNGADMRRTERYEQGDDVED